MGLYSFGEAWRGELEHMIGGEGLGSMRGKGGGREASGGKGEGGADGRGVPARGGVGQKKGGYAIKREIVIWMGALSDLFENLAAVFPRFECAQGGSHHDGSTIGFNRGK